MSIICIIIHIMLRFWGLVKLALLLSGCLETRTHVQAGNLDDPLSPDSADRDLPEIKHF